MRDQARGGGGGGGGGVETIRGLIDHPIFRAALNTYETKHVEVVVVVWGDWVEMQCSIHIRE